MAGDEVVSSRVRVAVYDLYWSTYGGGEQVDGSIAEILGADHDVTLLGPSPVDVDTTRSRLGVDLSDCGFRQVADDAAASAASADFDVFVNGTYLSRAINRAPVGYYYVHFPQQPPTRADQLRHRVGTAAVRVLRMPPRLPQRLREVRAGFDRWVVRAEHLPTYTRYLANSRFTAHWVRELWGAEADVLYPPVRPEVRPGAKRPLILSLGRFFLPSAGHSKKQLDLIGAFERIHRSGRLRGWELSLVGGCDAASREYALAAKRAVADLPASVHVNAPGELVRSRLAEAALFWHAAGFGEDPRTHPQRFEHFGISVVEAMAAGAVPLVYGEAGPAEIVRDGVDGFHWHTIDELIARTCELAADPQRREALSAAAIDRSRTFAADRFAAELRAFVAADVAQVV